MNTPTASATYPDWKASFVAPRAVVGLAALLALVGALFYQRLWAIASVWMIEPNYSHGFLIVPISVGLAYLGLKGQTAPLRAEVALGGFTIAVGVLVLLGTSILRVMILDFLALALILRGSAVAIGGRGWASALSFPIFFLFFMFPLPVVWTNFTSVWLQDWVSWVSGQILQVFFVCQQQGNRIVLAGVAEPLYVAQECSGLRQLVSFVALATLVGHLSKKGVVFSLLMVLAAVPVAIVSNVLRVVLMAVVIRYIGPSAVSGWLHDVPALLTLPIGLLMFFLLHKCLGDFFATQPAVEEGR